MTSYSDSTLTEACAKVKNLGYAATQLIRIYGEEFEIVSDPFPHSEGIAIHVKAREESGIRILRLPAMLLHAVVAQEQRFRAAA